LRRRVIVIAAVGMVAHGATGCVSSGKFDAVVSERDRLVNENQAAARRLEQLEVSNTSLEAERVGLYDTLENLRIEGEALSATRSALEQDVMRLSESEGELSERLEQTSEALALAAREARDLESTYQGLVADLESELQKGEIEIEQLRSGLRVALSQEILFRSGSARLDTSGRKILKKVAENVAKLDYAVDVEGHSDNIPILGPLKERYPSNWELAGARASSVVRVLEDSGISGDRLQAISRAEYAPLASNDDAQGRRANRRIEIRLRPRPRANVTAASEAQAEEAAPAGDRASEPVAASDPS